MDKNGCTVVHYAAQQGNWAIVDRILTERGASVEGLETLLFYYTYKGDLKMIQNIASKEKIDVNTIKDKHDNTLLHIAAQKGHLTVVEYLLEKKADVCIVNNSGKNSISYAAEGKYWNIVESLLRKNAKFNDLSDDHKLSLLNYSAQNVHWDIVKLFMEDNDRDGYFNLFGDHHKVNLFCYTAEKEHWGVIEFLLKKGINFNILNNRQKLALFSYSAKNTHWDIVEMLINTTINNNLVIVNWFLDITGLSISGNCYFDCLNDKQKMHFLYYLIYSGNSNITKCFIKKLIEKGKVSNVNTPNSCGKTFLHLAAQDGNLNIVQYLVDEKGANLNAVTNRGSTPLHLAAMNDQLETVKHLVEKGADLMVKNIYRRTPKDLAAEKSYINVVKFLKQAEQEKLLDAAKQGNLSMIMSLIEQGAECTNRFSSTPLHCAARKGHLEIVKYLVDKRGTDFKGVDGFGFTPLHGAAIGGHLEIVKYLVDKGADVNCVTYIDFIGSVVGRRTPLHWAARSGSLKVVKYLVDKGADINCLDSHDSTPLDLARMSRYNGVTPFLKERGAKLGHELKCSIQLCQKQQRGFLDLSLFISNNFPNASIESVKQGLYLPFFEERGVKIDGKCTAITRGLSQALLSQSSESFLSNLKTSSEIYERIVQGKQVCKREEKEVFAFSKLLNNFERQLDSAMSSLPSRLIHSKDCKTLNELSNYIAGIKGDFAIHLLTSNHVVAIYRTGDNYAYFDSNIAFVSMLNSVVQLMEVIKITIESAGNKIGEKGFLVEHFNVDNANKLLSDEDRQVLKKEFETECQLLAEQDVKSGPIKINGQEVSRVQLYNFGTKINVEGGVPLLINADMKLSSKKFQYLLDRKEVCITAREYLDHLKDSENVEEVIQATKVIPFIGSKREAEEAEQTREPKQSLLEQLVKGVINFIASNMYLRRVV